jgi:molecular chaperone GrpE
MAEQSNPNPQNASPEANGANPETGVVSEVEVLKVRLQAAEQQREEYLTLARQTRADFENYQKRFQRDLATERRFAQAPLAGDLLPALDNLERALGSARQAGDAGALVQGVAMVQTQLLDALRRHGVTRIEAQGQPFDPNLHQAVMQQPSAEQPPGTVLGVLEQGYLIHDRVLRPARVIVSAAPA